MMKSSLLNFLCLPRATLCLSLATVLFLEGCAVTAADQRRGPDPFEPVNRSVALFNSGVDKAIVKPSAQVYYAVMPELFRGYIGNFFSNLGDVWTGTNNMLQGKPKDAFSDWSRFTINTVFGFLGALDIASEMGLGRHNEDFGQTLAVWGVKPGPFIMLPILGPSSLRDTSGLVLDTFVYPTRFITKTSTRYQLLFTRAVDTRASFLSAEHLMDNVSIDDYSFLRDGFFQRRYSQVFDGNPPESAAPKYEDDDEKTPAKPSGDKK